MLSLPASDSLGVQELQSFAESRLCFCRPCWPRQVFIMSADQEFDFVIVGGGTAGLVVANRLTENPDNSVLVLEAGSDRLKDPRITIPGLTAALYDNPEFDWSFKSVPQARLWLSQHPSGIRS